MKNNHNQLMINQIEHTNNPNSGIEKDQEYKIHHILQNASHLLLQ